MHHLVRAMTNLMNTFVFTRSDSRFMLKAVLGGPFSACIQVYDSTVTYTTIVLSRIN